MVIATTYSREKKNKSISQNDITIRSAIYCSIYNSIETIKKFSLYYYIFFHEIVLGFGLVSLNISCCMPVWNERFISTSQN